MDKTLNKIENMFKWCARVVWGVFSFLFKSILNAFLVALMIVIIVVGMINYYSDIPAKNNKIQHDTFVLEVDFTRFNLTKRHLNPYEEIFSLGVANLVASDIVNAIYQAADDDRVSKLLFHYPQHYIGGADIYEIVQAVNYFKSKEKETIFFTYGFEGRFGQSKYYLASVFDQIIMLPVGNISLGTPNLGTLFFKDGLEEMGVKAHFAQYEDYKAGPEPYTRNAFSDTVRQNETTLLHDFSNYMLSEAMAHRGEKLRVSDYVNAIIDHSDDAKEKISAMVAHAGDDAEEDPILPMEILRVAADEGTIFANMAMEYGFIDQAAAYHQIKSEDDDHVSIDEYIQDRGKIIAAADYRQPHIAVIEASGAVIQGYDLDNISSEHMEYALDLAYHNDNAMAVLIKIDSPGGEIVASEVIYQKIQQLSETKPVLVLMQGMAASGGYYIAAPANFIMASPVTITGSIGVYSGYFDASELLKKVKLHYDSVQLQENDDRFSAYKTPSEKDLKILWEDAGVAYDAFLERVSYHRFREEGAESGDRDKARQVAGGRVYTGRQARDIGLVDRIGTEKDAKDILLKVVNDFLEENDETELTSLDALLYPPAITIQDVLDIVSNTPNKRYIQAKMQKLSNIYALLSGDMRTHQIMEILQKLASLNSFMIKPSYYAPFYQVNP